MFFFRFCPENYSPFDPTSVRKYVVGEDFIPPWDIPSLNYTFNNLKYTKKEALFYHIRKDGI